MKRLAGGPRLTDPQVAPGLPHCVDAVYESPARTCDFVDGLQLVLFPASFRLPAADGAASLTPAGALVHACHAALVRLSRRLDFLHWDQHPDLALSLHNLLGLLHDSLLSHRAEEGGPGDPADGGQAGADPQIVAGRQQAHAALLKALEPPPASRANQTRLAREVQVSARRPSAAGCADLRPFPRSPPSQLAELRGAGPAHPGRRRPPAAALRAALALRRPHQGEPPPGERHRAAHGRD